MTAMEKKPKKEPKKDICEEEYGPNRLEYVEMVISFKLQSIDFVVIVFSL